MDIKIGNIIEQNIDEIWLGERAEKLRESFRDGSFRYCRATSCPFLENKSLEVMDDDEFEDKSTPLRLPSVIYLANDFVCNHSCPSCRHDIYRADKDYLDKFNRAGEVLLPLLNQAEEISSCGNGDLFSSPHMIKLLARVKPQRNDFKFQIETNGVLFNEGNWEKIKNLHDSNISVVVTPNSYNKTTYEYLNGGHDDYNELMDSLNFIRDLRRKNRIKEYSISIVVQESNYTELPSFIERSFDEFEVDHVIVKPLYRWFKMSDEDFWFKDVLNPMHPYHKSWKQMMDSPILNDKRVYLWGAKNIHKAMRHPAYVYEDMIMAQNKLIANENDLVNKIREHVDELESSSITFYGDNMITETVVSLLKNKFAINIVARDFCRKEINGVEVKPFCKENVMSNAEIVVLNFDKFCYIKRDLDFMGYKGRLLTLPEWISEIGL